MRYVLVISPGPLAAEDIRQLDDGIRFDDMGSNIVDWADEADKFERLDAMGAGRRVYAVHFKDVDALKSRLVQLLDRDDVVLDDDYALFVSGAEFVELCKRSRGNRWWLGGDYS